MRYHIEEDFQIIRSVSMDEIKNAEVEILRTFVEFCEAQHLRYFLAGGTLIGAVRHQGFVPWDDDLDVTMPRPDFERFRALTAEGKLGRYEIRSLLHTPEIHCRPFDRIVDPRYMCALSIDQVRLPPWLDILPWDGLPADEEENRKHWEKVRIYKRLSRLAREPISRTPNRLKRYLKYGLLIPVKGIGPNYFAEQITKLARKYDFETAEYIGTFVAGYGPKERMPKYYFLDGEEKMWFEGVLCAVPAHYDLVLRHMYGNYMKLPSKKHRTSHMIKAWEVARGSSGEQDGEQRDV